MHFDHLKHQSHYHFTGHPLSTQPVAGVMYSQLLVLFLKMKKKEKSFFFLLKDFKNLQRGFMETDFVLWDFLFLSPIGAPLKRTRNDEGFILYTLELCIALGTPTLTRHALY